MKAMASADWPVERAPSKLAGEPWGRIRTSKKLHPARPSKWLNPDIAWWGRRTFDRILPDLFSLSYRKLLNLGATGGGSMSSGGP
jgi:hypothetical protein